jgi:hypothetical protein
VVKHRSGLGHSDRLELSSLRNIDFHRFSGPWGEEVLWGAGSMLLEPLAKGKINDWSPEWRPLVRYVRNRKLWSDPFPFDLLPPQWKEVATARLKQVHPWEKDGAIKQFIEENMPPDRKRKGVPKGLMNKAKDKFGLNSKSAVLRAFNRGKKRKELGGLLFTDISVRERRLIQRELALHKKSKI